MSSTPPSAAPKRILVLGSTEHPRSVTCYNWHELPRNLNVADYDIVILNLVPLLNKEYASKIDTDSFPTVPQFMRQIFGVGGEIVAIGIPDKRVGSHTLTDWWLPFTPDAVSATGQAITIVDTNYSFHFANLAYWYFHLDSTSWPILKDERSVTSVLNPRVTHLRISKQDLAVTRFGLPIAFELRFELTSIVPTASGGVRYEPIESSGPIVWLPPTTSISHVDAVNSLLRNKYGLLFEKSAPEWASKYKLPRQVPVEHQIENLQGQVKGILGELRTAKAELSREIRYLGMLYDQGEDVLEPLVRDALRELGATVTDPVEKGKHDGRLIDPFGREAILEIKGRTGTLRLVDVRQLDQWVRDVLFEEGKQVKGLLLGNLNLEQPLEARGEVFPSNCVQGAERGNHALLTTSQLLRALQDHQNGILNLRIFWDDVLGTVGLSKLPQAEAYQPEGTHVS